MSHIYSKSSKKSNRKVQQTQETLISQKTRLKRAFSNFFFNFQSNDSIFHCSRKQNLAKKYWNMKIKFNYLFFPYDYKKQKAIKKLLFSNEISVHWWNLISKIFWIGKIWWTFPLFLPFFHLGYWGTLNWITQKNEIYWFSNTFNFIWFLFDWKTTEKKEKFCNKKWK